MAIQIRIPPHVQLALDRGVDPVAAGRGGGEEARQDGVGHEGGDGPGARRFDRGLLDGGRCGRGRSGEGGVGEQRVADREEEGG